MLGGGFEEVCNASCVKSTISGTCLLQASNSSLISIFTCGPFDNRSSQNGLSIVSPKNKETTVPGKRTEDVRLVLWSSVGVSMNGSLYPGPSMLKVNSSLLTAFYKEHQAVKNQGV